jgi:hypothetical protein
MLDPSISEEVTQSRHIKLKGELLQLLKFPQTRSSALNEAVLSQASIGTVQVLQEQANLHTLKVFPTRVRITSARDLGIRTNADFTYITHQDGPSFSRNGKAKYSYWIYVVDPQDLSYYWLLAEFLPAVRK